MSKFKEIIRNLRGRQKEYTMNKIVDSNIQVCPNIGIPRFRRLHRLYDLARHGEWYKFRIQLFTFIDNLEDYYRG